MERLHHYQTATDFPVGRVALLSRLPRVLVERWDAGTLPAGVHALLSRRILDNLDATCAVAVIARWQQFSQAYRVVAKRAQP